MKVLLTAVNAKYIHSNLAVYDLRAYAETYGTGGAQVEIAEYTINHTIDYILEGIYKAKPDVLCFSCYIWNLDYVEQLMDEYHKICPEVPIWVGGPEVSYETEAFLKEHPQVTGVMTGEGEETFLELCESYAKAGIGEMAEKMNLSGIKGIMYRAGESLVKTGAREPLDLNRIPFCYGGVEDFRNRIIYYESSRGCPFRCSYCLSSVEKTLRFRDVERVKKELAFFLEQEVAQVKFVDRTFNCRHEHAMEIWKFLIEHDNGVTNFHFEISADLLTDEEIALIGQMRPGLIQLEIGVQSTNDATITEIHRTMQLDRLKAVVRSIQEKENIHEHLDLIAGLPYEGYETFARSFDEIYALKPNQLQLGFLKVLKGSYMYEHATEYGLIYRADRRMRCLRQTGWGSGRFFASGRWKRCSRCITTADSTPQQSGFWRRSMRVRLPCLRNWELFMRSTVILEWVIPGCAGRRSCWNLQKSVGRGCSQCLERVWYMTCMKERISEADPRGQQMQMNGNR